MPSRFPRSDDRTARRRLLAGIGTAVAGGLAGCNGRLPGTGPTRLDVETSVERDEDPRVLWQYPPREGETEGIGYASVEVDRIVRRDGRPTAVNLTFNSTIGGIASAEPYEGYHPDWFRFRVRPPETYDGRINHHVRVEPPGQWEEFSAYYDVQGLVRRTTVELRDVETRGTIEVPAVFDPGANGLPDRLHCSFTVQASRPGLFGKTVRVAGRGAVPVGGQ
ncbi:hypothetical protein [Halorarum halobium]|uniref:hypothetical protein n=1 Tax=Halorarum halobium TaxID=3075121 RepID=UPI0028A649F8|nr:hypothetical protein [Halobaculum sp. XH14]